MCKAGALFSEKEAVLKATNYTNFHELKIFYFLILLIIKIEQLVLISVISGKNTFETAS